MTPDRRAAAHRLLDTCRVAFGGLDPMGIFLAEALAEIDRLSASVASEHRAPQVSATVADPLPAAASPTEAPVPEAPPKPSATPRLYPPEDPPEVAIAKQRRGE